MKTKLISGIVILFLVLSCDSSFEDLNSNQNSITTDEVIPPSLLIKGTMLADIAINNGHLQRIAGMWTGQYRGEIALYLGLYNYDISSSESNSDWTYLYNGMLKQFSEINKYYAINGMDTEGQLIVGICKVLEAHAVGTATSIWGDIPYSQAINPAISDPAFDKQSKIYEALQIKLQDAIDLLSLSSTKSTLTEDIFFAGNKDKWVKTAYTLKARYYLQTRDYVAARAAALNGIPDYAGTMKFTPLVPAGTTSAPTGTENLLHRFMAGTRKGYLTVNNTFCRNLLDTQTSFPTISRRNAKTNEQARRNHLNAGSITGINTTTIINGELKPMDLVTYQENLLILAETGARTVSFDEGLLQLNKVREFLASDFSFDKRSSADVKKYDAYVTADFAKRKSGVTITGTAGQFSCSPATIEIGNAIVISGTLAGTGTINGYTSPKTYYVKATNGTTTFTLSETLGGTAIATTVGTPTGLTYSGMENPDNIDSTRALLREIIEERYVTGFGTFMPWNDARRLRKSEPDIAVPIPFNNATATKHPERFIISQDEINSNSNAPKGLTIYSPTELNE